MAKDIFDADFEDKSSGFDRIDNFSKKVGSTLIEKSGIIIAGVILVCVAIVMTSDISFISINDIKDFSIEAFILLFLCNGLYGSMYHSGMLSAKQLERYKKLKIEFARLQDEIKEAGLIKKLSQFCKNYVDTEHQAIRTILLERADVTWKEYLKYRHCSRRSLQEKGLSKFKINGILAANKVKPILLTADRLYKDGGRGLDESRSPLRTAPSYKRFFDFYVNFYKTAFTSVGMCFVGFQLFSDPSWETMCAVAIKIVAFILTGYSGYRHGYDSVAITECNYVSDQIDLLEQYQVWRYSETVTSNNITDVPALESGEK